jgi:hypothetical protein
MSGADISYSVIGEAMGMDEHNFNCVEVQE